MSLVLRRSYIRAKNNILFLGNSNTTSFLSRPFSEDNIEKYPEYSSSTILVEQGFSVQELPLIVRKVKDLSSVSENIESRIDETKHQPDTQNYLLIQEEFRECAALRDVFTLLSKCAKITPNIALVAMEKIYDLEKNPHPLDKVTNYTNVAKVAIIDKLLRVVMKTEDTQTILNAVNAVSSFVVPYKNQFCDEILLRISENKLSIEQICMFMTFLVNHKNEPRYLEMIDKLWIGLLEREKDIDENNIVKIFVLLPHFRESKRIVMNLLEQKLSELWCKIKLEDMQEILNTFLLDKCWCPESLAVVGGWLHANIHLMDEDSLLDFISKFTSLKYRDNQIEKSLEKYVRMRGPKLKSPILIVGILNFCTQFRIRNQYILDGCSQYFIDKGDSIPYSFLKSIVYSFGFLYYGSDKFWAVVKATVNDKCEKMTIADISLIILSFIYVGKSPLVLINKIFTAEYLSKINNNEELMKKMHLIDTALALECKSYSGPMLPKDQWSKPVSQDGRIKKIISLINESLVKVAGGADKLSKAVFIPHMHSDETYFIDIMLHPVGLGSSNFNWKLKSAKNENVAVLIHLPEHYCSDDVQLVGPQEMKKRHMKLLGMSVVSLRYETLFKLSANKNNLKLEQYLLDSIKNAGNSD